MIHVTRFAVEFSADMCCIISTVETMALFALLIVVANGAFVMFITFLICEGACTMRTDDWFHFIRTFSFLHASTIKTFCLNKESY
jgi:hypothetical protein